MLHGIIITSECVTFSPATGLGLILVWGEGDLPWLGSSYLMVDWLL